MKSKNVRKFEGVEDVEELVEAFEAFASDTFEQLATLSSEVNLLRQSLIFLGLAKASDHS